MTATKDERGRSRPHYCAVVLPSRKTSPVDLNSILRNFVLIVLAAAIAAASPWGLAHTLSALPIQ